MSFTEKNTMLLKQIKSLASSLKPDLISNRRHLHQNPELSFEEAQTSQFIAEELNKLGVFYESEVAGHGVVGYIFGKEPQSCTVALRADMDALPIVEQNEVAYKSQNEGVMHACGHDVHTSSLLGVASILQNIRESFYGTVKLIFQPAEEKLPGGASLMIKEGVLKANPQSIAPASIIGQHVMPQLEVGKIGFREGMYMASADEIYMTIKGKGGHAATPENCIDPIIISAQILVALQQVISRNASPKMPSVLSFGKIQGLGATNVIPNEVYLEGTFRTFDEIWRKEAHKKIRNIAVGMAESMGATCEVDIKVGYPFLKNNPQLTKRLKKAAVEYMGESQVIDLDLWLASEDFAFYSQVTDACFYRLGTRNESKGIVSGVHTPTFDVDELALPIGAGLMAWLTINELNHYRE
jgi:amidohydrolase